MKKLTAITILILILFANPAIAQDEYVEWTKRMSKLSIENADKPGYGVDYHTLILKQANEDWQGDYTMIAWEIKKQCKAFYDFTYMEKPVKMTDDIFTSITVNAVTEWGKFDSDSKLTEIDWTMVLWESKKQIKAYLEIH